MAREDDRRPPARAHLAPSHLDDRRPWSRAHLAPADLDLPSDMTPEDYEIVRDPYFDGMTAEDMGWGEKFQKYVGLTEEQLPKLFDLLSMELGAT